MSWTALSQNYTPDTVYCLPIVKARALVSDALKLRIADSLNNTLSERAALLQSAKLSDYNSFTNLLNISEQKFQKQKEITSDFVRLSDSWRDQSEYYRKEDRKHRRQRNGLGFGLVAVIILTLVK